MSASRCREDWVESPWPQRGHRKRNDVKPVIQVFAEPALADQVLQVLMRRRYKPDIDLNRIVGADPLEGLLLQHAQQLRLEIQGNIADLVEEECAGGGEFEPAGFVADRAGKGPFDVPKQFTLEQTRGERGAVDFDKRLAGAGTGVVNRFG